MGFFDRIRNSISRRVEQTVEGIEQANPEAVYNAAIDATKEDAVVRRAHAAALVSKRDQTARNVEALARESEQLLAALQEALAEGDDDTALVLQMRRDELGEQIESSQLELAELTEQANAARQAMMGLKDAAGQLERERDRKLAQLAAIQATLSVQEANSGLSDSPDARALNNVRERIERLEGRAGLDEVSNIRARALERAADGDTRRQLEELKKKYGRPGDK